MTRANKNSRQRARAKLFGEATDRPRCRYCGRAISRKVDRAKAPVLMGGELTWPFTMDHVIPKSMGGPYSMDNLISACEPCNTERGDMPILDFVLKLGQRSIMSTREAVVLLQRASASRDAIQARRG